jgi:hypothetical protein
MERIIMNPIDDNTAESSDVSTEEDMKRAVPLSSGREYNSGTHIHGYHKNQKQYRTWS